MITAEQARWRLNAARSIGREPRRWIATRAVAGNLMAEAPDDWHLDGSAFLGLPVVHGETPWGLVLVSDV